MRLPPGFPLAAVALAVAGCGALDFDVAQAIPEQTVAGSANPLDALLPGLFQIPFTVDIKSETKRRDTGPARSAALKQLTLTATPHAAPSGNFDFIDEIHIYIEGTGGTVPKAEIARLAPVPKGRTKLALDVVPGVDLLPYSNSSAGATITSSATGHKPSKDVSFDGQVVVTVRF